MSTLRELQSLHVCYTGRLIEFCNEKGYQLTWSETYRTPEQAMMNAQNGSGITHSLHLIRLAVDLNLFKDGQLLSSVEDYKPLGEFWKSLDPRCCWGGDFQSLPDADHFSLTWNGVR